MLPAVLPLFPLSQVALFPHTFLPLHIFEPRYRQLTRDVLISHQHFILALARRPVTTEPQDAPAVYPAGVLARIVRAEPLDDGRWNLLVQGMGVCRILDEVAGQPYRQAGHEPWPYDPKPVLEARVRRQLIEDLQAYARKHDMEAPMKELLALPLDEDARLNTLAMALEFDPSEKQFLLESPDLPTLADRLSQLLAFDLGGNAWGEGLVH
jgi:hypothetical protein